MGIRCRYNEALDKLDTDVDCGLTELIDIYCIAINSFENDLVDSIALYVTVMGNENTCNYLKKVLLINKDPYLKKEFNEWIKEIERSF